MSKKRSIIDSMDLEAPPVKKQEVSKKVSAPVFSGRISGVSQFQVRVERLDGNILVAYIRKARKNEEAFGGPLVSALAEEEVRNESQVTQVFKRRDPDSSTGEPLKCRAGSIYDWNIFAYIGEPGENVDVVDWGSRLADVFNQDKIVSKYSWPVHFSLTADETKEPLRKADEVMADCSVAAILDGKFNLRHPKIRQTLENSEWKDKLKPYVSDPSRVQDMMENYFEELDNLCR